MIVKLYLPGLSFLGGLPAWSTVTFPFAAIVALSEPTNGRSADPTRSVEVKVPRLEWADRGLRDTSAQAQLTFKRADSQLRVQGSSPLALVLEGAPRIELAALEMTAQLSHPALAADLSAQLKGKLDINLQQQSAQGTWSGQLAGSDVKADVAVADYAGRGRWTVDAELARLDLDALLSTAWLARWQDDATPLDVALLHDATC
jgi:hypothetical protein